MGLFRRAATVLGEELAGIHPRLIAAQCVVRLIPNLAGIRLRRLLYSLAGFRIGKGAVIFGPLFITGAGPVSRRLTIGRGAIINAPTYFNLGAEVRLGDGVGIGPFSSFITDSHKMGDSTFRAGDSYAAPISVGDGAWIGTGVTILPGVTIGKGAVVAAGAVVAKDGGDNMLVAGIPAKPIKKLD